MVLNVSKSAIWNHSIIIALWWSTLHPSAKDCHSSFCFLKLFLSSFLKASVILKTQLQQGCWLKVVQYKSWFSHCTCCWTLSQFKHLVCFFLGGGWRRWNLTLSIAKSVASRNLTENRKNSTTPENYITHWTPWAFFWGHFYFSWSATLLGDYGGNDALDCWK